MLLFRTIIAITILAALSALAAAEDAPTPQERCDAAATLPLTKMQFDQAEDVLEPDLDYRAILCTAAGAIYVDLYEALTPITVNNFVFLARQGYYDGTTFHRVIPNFMAQAGDPTGSGRGGPGYRFGDEPVGFLTFDRPGLLAMANAGPGTNGSQFFVTTAPTPHLNYKHTIFGDVLVGQENVAAIRERDPAAASDPGEILQTVLIISDPAEVDSGDATDLEPAAQEQVVDAFAAFSGSMPPSLPLNEDRSGLFSSEQIAASVSADLRAAYADYADTYGHQYRYRVEHENAGCESAIYFTSLAYQVDVYASASAAAAAFRDDLTARLLESEGFSQVDEFYVRDVSTCAGDDGTQALSVYRIGRFVVRIDVLLAKAIMEQANVTADIVLADLSRQIEAGFAAIYRPEIR